MKTEALKIWVGIASGDGTDYDDWPENVGDLICWLEDARAKAPEEFQNDVIFRIEHEKDYEGYCLGSWEIGYWRDETQFEIEARLAAEKYRMIEDARRAAAKERALLAKLKEKYPD